MKKIIATVILSGVAVGLTGCGPYPYYNNYPAHPAAVPVTEIPPPPSAPGPNVRVYYTNPDVYFYGPGYYYYGGSYYYYFASGYFYGPWYHGGWRGGYHRWYGWRHWRYRHGGWRHWHRRWY